MMMGRDYRDIVMKPCRKCGDPIEVSCRAAHEEFCKGDYERLVASREIWRRRALKAEAALRTQESPNG